MIGVLSLCKIRDLREQGLSKVDVAANLGIHRNTVSKYWNSTSLPKKEIELRESLVTPYMQYVTERLDKWPELSSERLFQEIKKKGYQGSTRTLRREVAKIRPHRQREYKEFETLPGEQAQVDWGECGSYVINGRQVKIYCLVFTLSWSRVMYISFVTSVNIAVFLGFLDRAFRFIGGIPQTIVFDNAKVIVSEREGSIVRFNRHLLDLALRYGFTPKACWAYDPESKGKVESNVKYVKRGFYYAREFSSLEDLNAQATIWLAEIANCRIHGTLQERPCDRLKIERESLGVCPPEASLPVVIDCRKATKTSLISVEGNRYSVPSVLARRTVWFQRLEDRIEILSPERDDVLASHHLVLGKNQLIVNDDHYPNHAKERATRKSKLQNDFEHLASNAPEYLQGLARVRGSHLRDQMINIATLADDYTKEELESAFARAVEFGAFGYSSLKRLLEQQSTGFSPFDMGTKVKTILDIPVEVDVEKRDLSYYGGVI